MKSTSSACKLFSRNFFYTLQLNFYIVDDDDHLICFSNDHLMTHNWPLFFPIAQSKLEKLVVSRSIEFRFVQTIMKKMMIITMIFD